jgi:hypothetical protein
MTLTQPLREMSTRNIPRGKADNLTAICEPIVYKVWEPQHLITLWASLLQGYLYLSNDNVTDHVTD